MCVHVCVCVCVWVKLSRSFHAWQLVPDITPLGRPLVVVVILAGPFPIVKAITRLIPPLFISISVPRRTVAVATRFAERTTGGLTVIAVSIVSITVAAGVTIPVVTGVTVPVVTVSVVTVPVVAGVAVGVAASSVVIVVPPGGRAALSSRWGFRSEDASTFHRNLAAFQARLMHFANGLVDRLVILESDESKPARPARCPVNHNLAIQDVSEWTEHIFHISVVQLPRDSSHENFVLFGIPPSERRRRSPSRRWRARPSIDGRLGATVISTRRTRAGSTGRYGGGGGVGPSPIRRFLLGDVLDRRITLLLFHGSLAPLHYLLSCPVRLGFPIFSTHFCHF
mmetsp:Transcript_11701/g.32872  ORF Transcript_11701/g.32872 Transcript_11701/m.32872 type:complete len:339 (-) Transcript_11701:43-1059(-)